MLCVRMHRKKSRSQFHKKSDKPNHHNPADDWLVLEKQSLCAETGVSSLPLFHWNTGTHDVKGGGQGFASTRNERWKNKLRVSRHRDDGHLAT